MEPTLQEKTVVVYAGDRSEAGQYHRHGRAVFSSGQVYDGEWLAGHMDGPGRMSFPDGITYEGTFASDKITGTGVYQWDNVIYEGEVQDGLRHGSGTLTFTDSPVVYEGQWQHGKRHGRGALYYNPDKTAYYEGEWQDDMKHGQGTSMYPSGNSYTGSWSEDKRHGQGTMSWVTKGQTYSGEWSDGLPNGLGEHVWQQGMPGLQVSNHAMHFMYNRYFGMFKDGKRHGEGALWYSNGARYEGQWEHDRKQGQGVYIFEDGSVFSGQFAADRPVLDTGRFLGAAETFPAAVGTAATAAVDTSAAGPPAAGEAEANASGSSTPAGSAVAGPPGFGPRISALQLYIADLLQDSDVPAATYKAVSNLLIGHNTELRALYDRYSNRPSPLLTLGAPRNSWALQAGQLWELLRDSQLLNRHLLLQQACSVLRQVLEPPPAVVERRLQVLATTDAAAVLQQPQHPYDPSTELLYRDFCELLVRLSALRYPQLPSLEQQVQQVVTQHLLPLLGPAAGRTGGLRQSITSAARLSLVQQSSTASTAAAGAPSVAAAAAAAVTPGPGASGVGSEQLQQEDLVAYLQSQIGPLQQLYAAFLAGAAALRGSANDSAWLSTPVTVRQVVAVLQQSGVLQHWQLAAVDVANVMLEGVMSVADPEGPRAHMDEANLEPVDLDQQPQPSNQDAAYQELTYWIDAPMLLPELLWGLVSCAAVLPAQHVLAQLQQTQPQQQEDVPQADSAAATVDASAGDAVGFVDLLSRVQVLLEGDGGLLDLVLGLGPNKDELEQAAQQQETEVGQHEQGEQTAEGADG